MKKLLAIEELLMLGLSIYLFNNLSYAWWVYLIFFLAPDIGIAGYLINNKTGAIGYNIFHHKGLAIALYLIGYPIHGETLQATGLILFGHASFDRVFGFGLKHYDHFKHTHLGWMNVKEESAGQVTHRGSY